MVALHSRTGGAAGLPQRVLTRMMKPVEKSTFQEPVVTRAKPLALFVALRCAG